MTTTQDSGSPAQPGPAHLEWLARLPQSVRTMWDDTCRTMEAGSFTLVAAGARALIERVSRERVGDLESVPRMLDALEQEGYISRRHRAQLAVVAETGNAALHREFELDKEQASLVLVLIENLLRNAYLPEERVSSLRSVIPPRRRR